MRRLLILIALSISCTVFLQGQSMEHTLSLVTASTSAAETTVGGGGLADPLSASSMTFVRLQSEFLAVLGIMTASIVLAMRRRARIAFGYRRS